MNRPADHPDIRAGRVGVLLVNLGTPDAPTPQAVKRYLAEFLSDRRVVEIPPLLWQPILRGIILTTRRANPLMLMRRCGRKRVRRCSQLPKRKRRICRRGWETPPSMSIMRCAMAIRRSPTGSPR